VGGQQGGDPDSGLLEYIYRRGAVVKATTARIRLDRWLRLLWGRRERRLAPFERNILRCIEVRRICAEPTQVDWLAIDRRCA